MDSEIGIGLVVAILLLFTGKKKGDEPTETVFIPPKPDDNGGGGRTTPEPDGGDDEPTQVVIDPDALPPFPTPDGGPALPEIVDEYPRPAAFYQVKKGDFGYGIAKDYLRSAGYLAAREIGGLDHDGALAFAKQVAARIGLQKQVWRAISCNGWNDATVTTYGWKGKSQPLAPTGRVVRLLPQHANNLARLAAGQPPIRNMRWLSPAAKGKGGGVGVDGSYRSYETLWLPGCDLKLLWESGGATLKFGGTWKGGASKTLPPPWVLALGVQFIANPPTRTFGCDGMTWTVQ